MKQIRMKALSLVMAAALCMTQLPVTALAVIAEDKQLTCTQEEHAHNESCYENVLTCTEQTGEHEHEKSCYEGKLTCEKEEHAHGEDCYSAVPDSGPEGEKDKAECSCGSTGDTHAENCPLYASPEGEKECTCGSTDNTHAEDCELYQAPDEPVCSQLEGCGDNTHDENCPLYTAPEGEKQLTEAAKEVQEQIDALPAVLDAESFTDEQKESALADAKSAKAAYDALSDDEKNTVTGIESLNALLALLEGKNVDNTKAKYIITAWKWVDEEEMLDPETGVLALPGASQQYVVSFEDITAFLPASITAAVAAADGEDAEETEDTEETVALGGWICEDYPQDGAYSGSYTFNATLPDGYALAENAKALTVSVELGGAQLFDEKTISSYTVYVAGQALTVTNVGGSWNTAYATTNSAGEVDPVTDSTVPTDNYVKFEVVDGTPTLTLKDANIVNNDNSEYATVYGIYFAKETPLTINGAGDNTIAASAGEDTRAFGIRAGGPLTLTGNFKSITATATNATGIEAQTVTIDEGCEIGKITADENQGHGILAGNGSVTIKGTLGEVTAGRYTVNTSNLTIAGTAEFTNTGLIEISGAAELNVNSGATFINTGTIKTGATYSINNNGSITNTGTMTLGTNLTGSSVEITNDGGSFTNAGTIEFGSGSTVTVTNKNNGTFINNGTLKVDCQNKNTITIDGCTVERIHNWSNGTCTNCREEHVHAENDCTYELGAAQNILNATCGVCKGTATITLTAPNDLIYDGNPKTVTVTQSPERAFTNLPAVQYPSGNTDAGNRTATLNCGGQAAEVKFTIRPCEVKGAAVTVSGSYSYTGSAIVPEAGNVSVTLDGKTFASGTDYAYTASSNVDAGPATVTVTFKGNYSGTAEGSFTIGKAAQPLSFAESTLNKTYGDSAFTPTINHVGDGAVTYTSSNPDVAGVDIDGKVTIKNAGTTKLTISAAGTDNYNASTEAGCTLTVNKKPVTVCLANMGVTVGSTAPTVALTYQGLVSGDTVDFTPAFTLTDKDGNPLKGADGAELTFADALTKAVSKVGSYTIKWDNAEELTALNETGNYTFTVAEGSDIATLTVKRKSYSGGGDSDDSDSDSSYSGGSAGTGSSSVSTPTAPQTPAEQPSTVSPQGYAPAGEIRPSAELPFIQGENGKAGWAAIVDELTDKAALPEHTTVTVDMNGAVTVPGNVLEQIKGKDITVVFDMGNGITWSVNGRDVTADKIGDINFNVRAGEDADKIPVDVINKVTGERYSIQISLDYSGEFGFAAILTIDLGKNNAGLFANLFYYNETTGEMEFICADEIAKDGTASLTFTHASSYTIVIDDAPMDGSVEEAAGSSAGEQDGTKTEDPAVPAEAKATSGKPILVVIAAVVIAAGLGAFLLIRKKKKE